MAYVQRLDSFEKAIAFHQHNAIVNDLKELFTDSNVSSSSNISRLFSISSSPTNSTNPQLPINVPICERNVCQVQFKHIFRYYRLPVVLSDVKPGEFIVVQSLVDKSQEDLGVITQIYSPEEFDSIRASEGRYEDPDDNKVGRVLRLAFPEELKFLPMKFQREHPLLRICQNFAQRHLLPMTVTGVEYQFDGNVLFVYYVARDRVDFRPLVKFLIKMYCQGTRVQMKNTLQGPEFKPFSAAADALITGKPICK